MGTASQFIYEKTDLLALEIPPPRPLAELIDLATALEAVDHQHWLKPWPRRAVSRLSY